MNLYQIHCGFYDEEVSDGIYEFHVNIPVVAENIEEAKKKVRTVSCFKNKKMHIDGIQEIKSINGYKITLTRGLAFRGESINNIPYKDL